MIAKDVDLPKVFIDGFHIYFRNTLAQMAELRNVDITPETLDELTESVHRVCAHNEMRVRAELRAMKLRLGGARPEDVFYSVANYLCNNLINVAVFEGKRKFEGEEEGKFRVTSSDIHLAWYDWGHRAFWPWGSDERVLRTLRLEEI